MDLVALEPGEEIRGSYQLFADGAGIAGVNTDGVGYFPVVWYEGDDPVAHVTLTFEEPTDGPPPAEPQLVLDPIGTYAQYVFVADVALPDSWELEVEARTPEGRVLESGTFAGSGTGVAYRGIPLIERKIVSYSGRASGTRYGVK